MNHPIKCAVCHITEMGFIKLLEDEVYPGDEKCSLICDNCIQSEINLIE